MDYQLATYDMQQVDIRDADGYLVGTLYKERDMGAWETSKGLEEQYGIVDADVSLENLKERVEAQMRQGEEA